MDKLDVRTKIGLVVVSASSISELTSPKAAPRADRRRVDLPGDPTNGHTSAAYDH